jgi:hypothetical protein
MDASPRGGEKSTTTATHPQTPSIAHSVTKITDIEDQNGF